MLKGKKSLMFAATAALMLAGCGGSGGKTQIGVLQFGSFEALERAKQGFVDAVNKSALKDKVEITVKNAAANGADNTSMASTLAAGSDLVYGIATPSATALKNAVGSLGTNAPVLFSAVTNAVGANLVNKLDAPEGNCTGVLDIGPIDQELEILSKFEGVDKVVSFFTSTEVNSVYQAEIAERWMDAHNIAHERKTITNASEITSAFAAIADDVDAVFLPTDDTIANSMTTLKAANDSRPNKLIVVGCDTGLIDGCTFAMGVDYYRCGVQAGEMAVKILNEKKPISEIPVETCSENNIFINKKLADELGINIPEQVLAIEGATILK